MINKIILGTVQLGLDYGINNSVGKPSKEQGIEILKLAHTKGITLLDTARAYGNSIEVIGEYHKNNPEELRVISKFHIDKGKSLKESLLEDLNSLKISFFEGVLFHSFSEYSNNKDLLKTLVNLKKEGFIRKVGVSVYINSELEEVINDTSIDLIQLPFNILDNQNLRGDLLKLAKEKNKEIHIRSAFLQGLFFKNPEELPDKLLPLKPYLDKVEKIANNLGTTIPELALLYPLINPYIDKVLIGVESVTQLEQNIQLITKNSDIDLSIVDKEINVNEVELLNPVNWK